MQESSACMIKLKLWNFGIWKSGDRRFFVHERLEPIEGEEARPADLEDKNWS